MTIPTRERKASFALQWKCIALRIKSLASAYQAFNEITESLQDNIHDIFFAIGNFGFDFNIQVKKNRKNDAPFELFHPQDIIEVMESFVENASDWYETWTETSSKRTLDRGEVAIELSKLLVLESEVTYLFNLDTLQTTGTVDIN